LATGGDILNNYTDISLNISVGGCPSGDSQNGIIRERAEWILNEAVACIGQFNCADYGFTGSTAKAGFFACTRTNGDFWTDLADSRGIPLNIVIPFADENSEHNSSTDKVNSVTNINVGKKRSTGSGSAIPDWIADQADFALLLWDGNEDFNEGETWALIQACKRNDIPCVWIDVNSPEDIYWTAESYFEKFTVVKLQGYISSLFCKNSGVFDPPGKSGVLFLKLWNRLYGRFMKKYKARNEPSPFIDDKLLDDSCEAGGAEYAGGANLKNIIGRFHYFDANAVGYARKYRASIYLRSIVPFIASVFITFGFFAETILGFIYSVPGLPLSPWSILASIGFLVNGLIYFYVYRLAESPVLASWRPRFIDNRFIAEYLRLTAHFAPFGIPVNYKASLNRFGSRISSSPHVACELRRLIRSLEPASVTFDKNTSDRLLANLRNMINDQIKYHNYSAQRYTRITEKLKKLSSVLFVAGLCIVVFRGFLQFVLVYVDIGYARNGIQLEAFIKSLINMLASVFPAWASYFSLKLSLGNFEGLLNNSREMEKYMTVMKNILDNEIARKDVSFERIYLFSRDLARLMLGEVTDWHTQISSQKFTKL
jgi:hypothetical protein